MARSYFQYSRRRARASNKSSLWWRAPANAKANVALAQVQKLKTRVHRPEQVAGNNTSSQAIDANGSFVLLTSFAIGDDYNNRQGRILHLKRLNGVMSIAQHASATETFVRVMLIRFMRYSPDSSTTPSFGELLNNAATYYAAPNVKPVQHSKYQILMDRMVALSDVGKTCAVMRFNKYYKKAKKIEFDGTGGTSASQGRIYLALISNESTNTPTVAWDINVHCVDY